ncbi:MAG TPA: hypothetical protein DCE44_19300 [Verrucomicrobiales bacterium]|nr:hypothetical protein [Verrucomicrobiales bacterium]
MVGGSLVQGYEPDLRPGCLTVLGERLYHAGVMRFDSNLAWLSALLLLLAGCAPRGAEALRRGDEALSANQPAEAVPLLERAVTDLPTDALA